MKTLLLAILFSFAVAASAQEKYVKRLLSDAELTQVSYHHDTIINRLNKLYKLEKKENAPGKYQPQRIELVRQYILIFQQIERQHEFVYYSIEDITQIFGQPDSQYREDGYLVYEYKSMKSKFISLKNIDYSLVFKNNELVFVKKK